MAIGVGLVGGCAGVGVGRRCVVVLRLVLSYGVLQWITVLHCVATNFNSDGGQHIWGIRCVATIPGV